MCEVYTQNVIKAILSRWASLMSSFAPMSSSMHFKLPFFAQSALVPFCTKSYARLSKPENCQLRGWRKRMNNAVYGLQFYGYYILMWQSNYYHMALDLTTALIQFLSNWVSFAVGQIGCDLKMRKLTQIWNQPNWETLKLVQLGQIWNWHK